MENTSCCSADAPTATRPGIFSGSRTCPGPWEVPTWAWRFPAWACSLLRNLTPDKVTGLGNWTKEQIATAIQTGVRPDGRILAPIMPWRAYADLTKSDIGAIVEYLSSLPAISHQVPGPFGLDEKPAIFRMTILPPEKASQRDSERQHND